MENFLNQAGLRKTVEGIKEYVDAQGLDYTNPIIVNNQWEILCRILESMNMDWNTENVVNIKAGKYFIKGSETYPLVTVNNRHFTPPLRNTGAIVEFEVGLIDPVLPHSPNHPQYLYFHEIGGSAFIWDIPAPSIKLITWDSRYSHIVRNEIPMWYLQAHWSPMLIDSQSRVVKKYFLGAGSPNPVIVNGMGHSVSTHGSGMPGIPGAGGRTEEDFHLVSVSSFIRNARRTVLPNAVALTDFNLMTTGGSYSIAATSILANAPPQTMPGNLRRICHVTETIGNGRIQELEIFSDAPDTPFVTWKRARRTASQDSWTPWERIYTSII